MAVEKTPTVFDDHEFLEVLTALLCKDAKSLRLSGPYLDPNDFKPLEADPTGKYRWIVAELALDFHTKHGQPVGRLLKSELLRYAKAQSLSGKVVRELLEYGTHILSTRVKTPDVLVDQVVQYKQEMRRARALEELIELQTGGKLTEDRWMEVTRNVLSGNNGTGPVEFFPHLEDRMVRRARRERYYRYPFFFIEPLDELVRGIGPGNLGMLLAPYKRGKSLMLLHMALAFTIQHLNVLYITMEDPQSECEDRLDAMITSLPIKELADRPGVLRRRYTQVHRLTRNRLRIADRTATGVSVVEAVKMIGQLRDHGFVPHVLMLDYDEEISPIKRRDERRLEFIQIYQDLRRLAADHQMIVWTASQTSAKTVHLKHITGEDSAEDKSKIRRVGMALGMGQGDWGADSIYLWVAAHKFDRMHVGCNIVSDKERMLIYDRERTTRERRRAELEEEE
jgi:hypothetical protein